MSSRDFIKHLTINPAPVTGQVGDEYFNPTSNKLYKNLIVSGTTLSYQEIPVLVGGTLSITTGTSATSTTTGALTVTGGAGIGGSMYVGGNSYITGNLGVGTTAPAGKFEVAGDIISQSYVNGAGSFYFQAKKSRGTISTPTVVLSNDTLGGMIGGGYDGSSYQYSGAVQFSVDGAVSAGVVPMAIQLMTGATNSYTERMRITSSGGLSFGASGTAYGTSGQILQSNGNATPTWVSLSGVATGSATTSTQVNTVVQTASATYYPTFVNANNASATGMSVYTTSSFVINPATGYVGIGSTGSTVARKLEIVDGSAIQLRLTSSGSSYADFSANSSGNIVLSPSGTTVYINAAYLDTSAGTILLGSGGFAAGGDIIFRSAGAGGSTINPVFRIKDSTGALQDGLRFNNSWVNSTPGTLAATVTISSLGYNVAIISVSSTSNTMSVVSTTSSTSTTTGALQVAGGVGIGGNLYVGGDIVANKLTIQLTTVTTTLIQTDDVIQTLNTTQSNSTITGALQVAGGAGIGLDITVGGSIRVASVVTATTFVGNLTGTATTATNLAGGTAGQVPYQTAPGLTSFISTATTGNFLQANYVGAPTWTTTGSMYVANAVTSTNLRAGTAGQLHYQSAADTSGFVGPGTAGTVLVSNGTSAPAYQNTLTLAGTSASTSTTTGALQVAGGVGIGGSVYVGNRVGFVSTSNISTVYQVYNAVANSLDTVFG